LFELFFKYPLELYERSSLPYTGSWPTGLLVLLALAGLGAIGWTLYARRAAATPGLLAAVGALQAMMLAVVLWLLALPGLETEELREGQNSLALVLDTSASMALGADSARVTRGRGHLQSAATASADLALAVQRYEFDASARRVDDYAGSAASGQASAVAESLRAVLQEARRSPLAAVVLASDGADTTGGLTTEEVADLAAFGVPVHTIAVGRASIPEDLELGDVVLPAKVLPDSTVTARVAVRHDGAVDTRLRVYAGDELLASEPVSLPAGSTNSTVSVDFELGDPGPREIRFSIDGTENELEAANNARTRLVDVIDDSYRVLYFEGEPRWEYKFMRRALNEDRDLSLESLLKVSPNKFYRQGIQSGEQLADGFPRERAELFAYDALIIGSVEAATLSPDQQQMIRDFVSERGGTLLMLGGRLGLGNGGWGQSAVADALPARLPAIEVDSFRRRQVPVALTPQGGDAAMLRFATDDTENQRQWGELPAVADYQTVGELKPAAVPLINAETDEGAVPLLITQAYGRGRSYILATGGTWRWQMSLPVEDQRHETFWQQLMRSLVAAAPPAVSLGAMPDGNGIELRAEFRDESFAPLTDIDVSAVVSAEDGGSLSVDLQPSATEAGIYVGRIEPDRSGTYFAEAIAARNDEPIATSRASLVLETGQSEAFGIRANPDLLERLSTATGGEMLTPERLNELPDLLRFSSAGITETEVRPIWDMPAIFLLLLLLKAAEWLLRRRRGTI